LREQGTGKVTPDASFFQSGELLIVPSVSVERVPIANIPIVSLRVRAERLSLSAE
jgi:hypothetical protein